MRRISLFGYYQVLQFAENEILCQLKFSIQTTCSTIIRFQRAIELQVM